MNSTELLTDLQSGRIAAFHDACITEPHWLDRFPAHFADEGLWYYVEKNHGHNLSLWGEEDLARRPAAPAEEIVANKRAIDRHNQLRNDAIERIDEIILGHYLAGIQAAADAWVNSETAGSIIDRLSIISLKIFHTNLQAEDPGQPLEHRRNCGQRLERLQLQRRDLMAALDNLLFAALKGKAVFKVYHQFKMYNDPAFNPHLKSPGK